MELQECLLQVTVVGLKYGDWATAKYGTGPTRVDALDFAVEKLKALHKECLKHQKDCLPPNEKVMPAAFITFKTCRTQVI